MKHRICILFLVLLLVCSVCDSNSILRAETSRNKKQWLYSGVLSISQDMKHSGYQLLTSFHKDVKVKVTVELDESNDEKNIGGHIQFAFVKDREHSFWVDDIALYPNTKKSYTKEFNLYAGDYTFEMYLIREDIACLPFRLKMEVRQTDSLPKVDKEATLWMDSSWQNRTIHKGNKNSKIDIYEHIGVSSWKETKRDDLVYKSSNTRIAAVDKNGVVTVKRTGNVRITIIHPNGNKVVSKIKVTK